MPQALESNVNTGGPGALGELGGQCQPTADTTADPGLATPADAGVSAVDGSDAARPARPEARDGGDGGDGGNGAACPGPEPCTSGLTLQRLRPATTLPVLSHAPDPAGVVHVAARLGEPMPPAWLLAIEGERFELGADLSAAARTRLRHAVAQAGQWINGQLEQQARPHA